MKDKDWMNGNASPQLQELMTRVEGIVTTGKLVVRFAALETYDKFCMLKDGIDWGKYIGNGVTIEQAERIMNNALEGRPKEEWLQEPEFGHARAHELGGRGRA